MDFSIPKDIIELFDGIDALRSCPECPTAPSVSPSAYRAEALL